MEDEKQAPPPQPPEPVDTPEPPERPQSMHDTARGRLYLQRFKPDDY